MTELSFAAIADDFTGAVDLAGMLVRSGLRTVLAAGTAGLEATRSLGVEALVVALKTRSIPAEQAVDLSLRAAEALQRQGARRLYFKYCSTFDSAPRGNIGPVAEALRTLLGAAVVPFVPSFPENGRRVYRGHLFVGNALLNESGLEHHPLNPMKDANLVRVLATQSQSRVVLIDTDVVQRGEMAVRQALMGLTDVGALAIVDAIDEEDLGILGAALHDWPLVTGGSALAFHLARRRAVSSTALATPCSQLAPRAGRCAILAGSCSPRTREQIAYFAQRCPALRLPVDELSSNPQQVIDTALRWAEAQKNGQPVLIYSADLTAGATGSRVSAQGGAIESAFASIAAGLMKQGVTRMVVAGGETSGAVVNGLGITALQIGPEISAGVSWSQAIGGGAAGGLCLALKSGNFGSPDLFTSAFDRLSVMESAA